MNIRILTLIVFLAFLIEVQSRIQRINVCEHSRPDGRTLQCSKGNRINIVRALYGRRSLRICGRAWHWGRTNCGTTSSFEKAKRLCNGKSKCYLRAHNSMFGDPCWGINKYLDVSYRCIPSNHPAFSPPQKTRLVVCEHARNNGRTITCPKNYQAINIVKAVYGRQSLKVCKTTWHFFRTNCGSSSSFKKAKQLCDGKQSCFVRASNKMFGDPCAWVHKYLDLTYECVGTPFVQSTAVSAYVGKWRLEYSNRHRDYYTIYADGFVHLSSSGRKVRLQESDNQVDFPSADGWYKLNRLFRDAAWEYVRLDTDTGIMEVRHFCTDGCNKKYKMSFHYCCSASGLQISSPDRPARTYSISVKTSNKRQSGTDANVYIRIYGELGDTGKFHLTKKWGSLFERNQRNYFRIIARDVGQITMMKIGHDNRGTAPKWHLDYISVGVDSCTSTFSVWKWIGGADKSKRQIDIYPTLEKGACPGLMKKMAGRYVISYTNGHQDVYVITKSGKMTRKTTGKTSTLYPSDNQKQFPSANGWYKSSKLHRASTWEYIRLNTDGSIEIHHFCTDGCRSTYKSLRNYCCKGVGTISTTGNNLLNKMAVEWSISYTNGHKDIYSISQNGQVTRKTTGKSSTLQESDNQFQFPSSEGWYKSRGLHRATTWEYMRLKRDGTLEVQHFCTDGCTGTYKSLKRYCCHGTGTLHIANTLLMKKMVGQYAVSYTNGHRDVYEITKGGRIARKTTNRVSTLKISDNQIQFPSSQGWFLSKRLHRDTTWEYIRLRRDGSLEIHHFCTDGCRSSYKSLKNYCCKGTASLLVVDLKLIAAMVGEYTITYTNRHKDVYVISEGGRVKRKTTGRVSTLQVSDNQIQFPSADGWFKSNKLQRDTTWEYIRLTMNGTLEIQHFCTDGCQGKYRSLKHYCCKGTGSTKLIFNGGESHGAGGAGNGDNAGNGNGNGAGGGGGGGDGGNTGGNISAATSTGSICRRDFRKIGCFNRDWSKVPNLIITDLDPTHTNYGKDMNWGDYAEGLHSLACRCRAKALGKYKYFGIGFFGECVAGENEKSLEEMFNARNKGNAEGCVNANFEACDLKHEAECSGAEDFDFFYEIVE